MLLRLCSASILPSKSIKMTVPGGAWSGLGSILIPVVSIRGSAPESSCSSVVIKAERDSWRVLIEASLMVYIDCTGTLPQNAKKINK